MKRRIIPLALAALLLAAALPAGPAAALTLDLGTGAGTVGDVVQVPVDLTDLGGAAILSWELDLHWSPTYAQCVGVDAVGTLSAGWSVQHLAGSGSVRIIAAGAAPLAGDGTLILLDFLLGPSSGSATLYLDQAVCNEGDPVPTLANGLLTISALPTINVSPDNGLTYVGGILNFSTSGGVAPYTYASSDPGVAMMLGPILLGTGPGSVRITATDDVGTSDVTTGWIEVRPFRLEIANAAAVEGTPVDVNLALNSPVGYGIVSMELRITWTAAAADFLGASAAGSILSTAGWGDPLTTSSTGQVTIVAAGDAPLGGAGHLLKLQFMPHSTFYPTLAANLFNEEYQAYPINGTVTVTRLPNLSVSPSAPQLLVGDEQAFSVLGGATPPVTWSVDQPALAEIDPDGVLTALAEGTVVVRGEDALGAVAVSGSVRICGLGLPTLSAVIHADETVTVPLTSDRWLDGLGITSMELAVSYNPTLVEFLGADTATSTTAGWGAPLVTDAGGVVRIYHAGSSALEACGPDLVKLTFRGRPGISPYYSTAWAGALFNEGTPCVLLNRGSPCTGVSGADLPPAGLRLGPNRPNPFNPGTTLSFSLERDGPVRLEVYDARGRCVRRLIDGPRAAGVVHEAYWDGRDDAGRTVASGVYTARLSTAGRQLLRKMVLLK